MNQRQIINANTGEVTEAPEGFFSRVEKNADTYENDIINEPNHYHSNGIDVIGFAELQFTKEQLIGFHRINVLKYVTRYDKKSNPLEDLQKAKFYLDKLIENVERDSDEL